MAGLIALLAAGASGVSAQLSFLTTLHSDLAPAKLDLLTRERLEDDGLARSAVIVRAADGFRRRCSSRSFSSRGGRCGCGFR